MRTHTHLMQERNRHMNRIHKILETANIKLSSVVTDIVGKSARQMLEALIAGESECRSCMNAVAAWMSTRKPS